MTAFWILVAVVALVAYGVTFIASSIERNDS